MVSMRKSLIIVVVLASAVAGMGFGQVRVQLTGDAVASFLSRPTAREVVVSFAAPNQPLYWGFGFEVVSRHFGIGGLYTANFTQNTTDEWWLDWYGEAIYLSYHVLGRRRLIDPFVTLGLGTGGRVYLGPAPTSTPVQSTLLLSIFPVVSGGLGVDLQGLYVSLKMSYLPVVSPIPATPFGNIPIGRFQTVASAGIAFGR